MSDKRLSGTVKSFDASKGYGYIEASGYRQPVFFYYASIIEDRYRSLKSGESVEFAVIETPQGPHATEIARR